MPKTTKADAIVKAAKELTQAIKNKLPSAVPATNMEAFMKLSSIFEEATEKWNENELLWQKTPSPRVVSAPPARVEETASTRVEIQEAPMTQNCELPYLKVEEELIIPSTSSLAMNTRSHMQPLTITQEASFLAMEMQADEYSQKKFSNRKFPLKLLCELVDAFMDEDTGELMQYQHLLSHPK